MEKRNYSAPKLRTHMTLGGETESSNPSRLMFSIKIPGSFIKAKASNVIK